MKEITLLLIHGNACYIFFLAAKHISTLHHNINLLTISTNIKKST